MAKSFREKFCPTDEKVLKHEWGCFRDLEIGEKFVFGSAVTGIQHFVEMGACEKISTRNYKYKTTSLEGKEVEITSSVGTINAIVVWVDENNNPKLAKNMD